VAPVRTAFSQARQLASLEVQEGLPLPGVLSTTWEEEKHLRLFESNPDWPVFGLSVIVVNVNEPPSAFDTMPAIG